MAAAPARGPSLSYRRITSVSQLRRGDHIAWFRPGNYHHHAIVEHVHAANGEVSVVHYYYHMMGGLIPIGKIKQQSMDPFKAHNGRLYVIQHPQPYYPPDAVIQRAHLRLGETKYRFIYNNCEHFATWAKTGRHASTQTARLQISPAMKRSFMDMVSEIEAQYATLVSQHS